MSTFYLFIVLHFSLIPLFCFVLIYGSSLSVEILSILIFVRTALALIIHQPKKLLFFLGYMMNRLCTKVKGRVMARINEM